MNNKAFQELVSMFFSVFSNLDCLEKVTIEYEYKMVRIEFYDNKQGKVSDLYLSVKELKKILTIMIKCDMNKKSIEQLIF